MADISEMFQIPARQDMPLWNDDTTQLALHNVESPRHHSEELAMQYEPTPTSPEQLLISNIRKTGVWIAGKDGFRDSRLSEGLFDESIDWSQRAA